MATRYVQTAQGEIAPVFNAAQTQVQSQIPATQALYDTLLAGLQNQVATGQQAVVNSAMRRGVATPALGAQVGSTLANDVALQQAQLGAQQAGDIANIGGNLTQVGTGRVQAANDLAGTIQNEAIQRAQAQLDRQQNQRDYELKLQEAQRNTELQRIQNAKQAARSRSTAASAQAQKTMGKDAEYLLRQRIGSDGHVSPDTYNEILQYWVAAGGDPSDYHDKFSQFINNQHAKDYYDYNKFVMNRSAQNITVPNF